MHAGLALPLLVAAILPLAAQASSCRAQSPAQRTPVIELYTSEGCSSCPPADRWLSGLKEAAADGKVVVQAFHVSYWDSLGWVDRFASPIYNARQREIAGGAGSMTVYTPQLVRNGQDSRDYGKALAARTEPAAVVIRLAREGGRARLTFRPLPPAADHAQQLNLVVFDPATGKPLQALSLQCAA